MLDNKDKVTNSEFAGDIVEFWLDVFELAGIFRNSLFSDWSCIDERIHLLCIKPEKRYRRFKEEQHSVLLPFSRRETRDIQDGSQISKTRVHNTDDAT